MLRWDSGLANQRGSDFAATALVATEGRSCCERGAGAGVVAARHWPGAPAASAMLRCKQWKKRDPLPSPSSAVPSEGAAGGGRFGEGRGYSFLF